MKVIDLKRELSKFKDETEVVISLSRPSLPGASLRRALLYVRKDSSEGGHDAVELCGEKSLTRERRVIRNAVKPQPAGCRQAVAGQPDGLRQAVAGQPDGLRQAVVRHPNPAELGAVVDPITLRAKLVKLLDGGKTMRPKELRAALAAALRMPREDVRDLIRYALLSGILQRRPVEERMEYRLAPTLCTGGHPDGGIGDTAS